MKDDSHDLGERVALFRHRLIAQLLPEELTARQRQQTIETAQTELVAYEKQIAAREGAHPGLSQKAWVKTTPSRANRSIRGDFICSAP